MSATQEAPVTEVQSDFLSVITGENRAQPVVDPVAEPVAENVAEGGADTNKGVNDTTEPAAHEAGKEEEVVKETADTKAEGETEEKEEAKEVDPLDAYISGTDPEPVDTPKEASEFLKREFGVETPTALKQQFTTLREQLADKSSKADQYDNIIKGLDSFPTELHNAIQKQLAGEDGVGYIQGLANGASLSKEAAQIAPETLIDAYFPKNKFTAAQREDIANNEADPAVQDSWDQMLELASEKHNSARQKEASRDADIQASNKKQQETFDTARAAAIAFVKNDKALAGVVNSDLIEKFSNGSLLNDLFFESDGSYKPEALAQLAKIPLHDKLVERIRVGAHNAGKNEGLLEATSRQPKKPQSGSERVTPPKVTEEQQQKQSVEQSILAIIGQR